MIPVREHGTVRLSPTDSASHLVWPYIKAQMLPLQHLPISPAIGVTFYFCLSLMPQKRITQTRCPTFKLPLPLRNMIIAICVSSSCTIEHRTLRACLDRKQKAKVEPLGSLNGTEPEVNCLISHEVLSEIRKMEHLCAAREEDKQGGRH